jgi:hypothetical protein
VERRELARRWIARGELAISVEKQTQLTRRRNVLRVEIGERRGEGKRLEVVFLWNRKKVFPRSGALIRLSLGVANFLGFSFFPPKKHNKTLFS